MKKIHICLVSDQPIPNLTTIFQFRPDTVVLLYTEDKKVQKDRLEKVLRKHGFQVRVEQILPYGMGNVIGVCESVIKNCPGCDISLNITGGTKIGTLGAFQAFYNADLPIYYVNTQNNQILQVTPTEQTIPIEVRISIRDYLAAYGFTVERATTDVQAALTRRAATEALRQLSISSERSIGKLNASMPRDLEQARFPLETTPIAPEVFHHCTVLEKCGIARPGSKGGLIVDDLDQARYLRGIWFEEYVFMIAQNAGADEVYMNVEGRWDVIGKGPPKNEFDVMMSRGNRLFFISCKTSNPNRLDGPEAVGKEYLYELDSLGDHALGLFGKKMLASARSITNDHLRQRAKAMGITILDKNDLHDLKGKIRQWLST